MNIVIVDEGKNLLGTGGAAKKSYKIINGPAFLTYGDTFLDVSYKDVYERYQHTKNPLMTIYKNNKLIKYSPILDVSTSPVFVNSRAPSNESSALAPESV